MIGPIIESSSTLNNRHLKHTYKTDAHSRRVPLPYVRWECDMTERVGNGVATLTVANSNLSYYASGSAWGRGSGPTMSELEYRSWKKLVALIGPRVNLSLNLLEAAQTAQLVCTLSRAVIRPLETVAALLQRAARKARKPSDSIAIADVPNAYLAYKFGVEPLIKDIYSGAELLASDQPVETQLGASTRGECRYVLPKVGYAWGHDETYVRAIRRGCIVTVSNPNVFMMAQTGLINPASVAFEAYPLSFVLNWLWPIGTYLSSFTDFAGLSVKNAYISRYVKYRGNQSTNQKTGTWTLGVDGVRFERKLGLETLSLPKFVKLNLNVGQIQSVGALLLQRVGRMKVENKILF